MSSPSTVILPQHSSSSTDDDDDDWVVGATQKVMPSMGTTSLAFLFKDGIILASYSHMSTKRKTSKIMEINPYTLCTMVGEPVDKLLWTQCELYKTQNERRLPIELAAELLEAMMAYYFGMESSAEALIAGWEGESPTLYLVDDGELGSVSGPRFSIGPGQSCVYDAFDVGYRYNMSISEAVSFAQWAIDLAASEVGAGNGAASVYYGGFNGWVKILGDDVVEISPSSGTMNIEDEETTVKHWQERLKGIEQLEFMFDAFCTSGIQGSDLPSYESRKIRKSSCGCGG